MFFAGLCGRCTGVAVPLRVVPSPTGLPSKRGPGTLCVEFSRQEYWGGLPFASPEDLPKPGVNPARVARESWGWRSSHCRAEETSPKLGVPLGGTRRVGGLLGVAGRLSGTVSPFRAEQGTSLVQKHQFLGAQFSSQSNSHTHT